MTILNGGLPTGLPHLVWNKHPEIKFFYATVTDNYIYFLYRSNVRCWTWEVWSHPPKGDARILLQASESRIQFHTAHAEANAFIRQYENA